MFRSFPFCVYDNIAHCIIEWRVRALVCSHCKLCRWNIMNDYVAFWDTHTLSFISFRRFFSRSIYKNVVFCCVFISSVFFLLCIVFTVSNPLFSPMSLPERRWVSEWSCIEIPLKMGAIKTKAIKSTSMKSLNGNIPLRHKQRVRARVCRQSERETTAKNLKRTRAPLMCNWQNAKCFCLNFFCLCFGFYFRLCIMLNCFWWTVCDWWSFVRRLFHALCPMDMMWLSGLCVLNSFSPSVHSLTHTYLPFGLLLSCSCGTMPDISTLIHGGDASAFAFSASSSCSMFIR